MMFQNIKVASAKISNVYFKVRPYYYGLVGGIVFSARRWLLFQMVTFQASRHGFLQSERRSFTR